MVWRSRGGVPDDGYLHICTIVLNKVSSKDEYIEGDVEFLPGCSDLEKSLTTAVQRVSLTSEQSAR